MQKKQWRAFAEAREFVRSLAFSSVHDYRIWSKSEDKPSDVPSNPSNAYPAEWTGWSDWLGVKPIYEDPPTRHDLSDDDRERWAVHIKTLRKP